MVTVDFTVRSELFEVECINTMHRGVVLLMWTCGRMGKVFISFFSISKCCVVQASSYGTIINLIK
jgi:hypothetical protein